MPKKPSLAAMKIEHFDIIFANQEGVYFAGQEMSGHLVVVLKSAEKINEILIELKGKAKTYWTKHSGKSRKHCSDSEPYFLEQFNTDFTRNFEKEVSSGLSERILPAGRHEVPFSFSLPKAIPSSFEGDFGHVRYTCKAILERSWDFDVVARRAFSVIGIEDMNENTKALEPIRLTDSNFNIRFCCRKQGTITVNLSLARTGYTPGETVVVNAEVVNDSNKTLRYSCAKIVQHTRYLAKTFAGSQQSKQSAKVIVKREKGEVQPRSTAFWKAETLLIPPVPPKLFRCKIIDVSYTLEFEVDPGIVVLSPLLIGTIPLSPRTKLLNSLESAAAASGGGELESEALLAATAAEEEQTIRVTVEDENGCSLGPELTAKKRVRMPSSVLSELYPGVHTPTFMESFFGKVDITDDKEKDFYGEKMFAPKYACYLEK